MTARDGADVAREGGGGTGDVPASRSDPQATDSFTYNAEPAAYTPTTAIGLIARWIVNALAFPAQPGDLEAIAAARLDQALRLPIEEREALGRLLAPKPVTHHQKGSTPWH